MKKRSKARRLPTASSAIIRINRSVSRSVWAFSSAFSSRGSNMDADSTTIPSAATTPDHISTVGTLKRLGETILSTLHNRLELLTLELKEEKYWLTRTLLFA